MRTWIKRSVVFAMAAAFISTSVAPASAYGWYRGGPGPGFGAGVAAGILGLGILGAAAAERERAYYYGYYGPYCHPGPLECHMYDAPCFHNEYGEPVCPPVERRCFRRPICD
ncbi:MAG: hypothetical protein ACLPX9_03950 [Rhodomicrobium sp.]